MESIRELKKKVNPYNENRKAPLYSRYFMRYISVVITWILLHTPITANQVTVFQIVPGVISAYFFALGKVNYGLLGILFWQISYLFDFVDGEIARYRNQVTIRGIYLDLVTHKVIESAIWFGLGWGLYRYTHNPFFIIGGFITAFFAIDILSACFPQTVISLIKSKKFLADIKPLFKEQNKLKITEEKTTLHKRVYSKTKTLFVSVTKMHIFTVIFLIESLFSFFFPLKGYLIIAIFVFYAVTTPFKEILSITKNLTQKTIENEIKELKQRLGEKLSEK